MRVTTLWPVIPYHHVQSPEHPHLEPFDRTSQRTRTPIREVHPYCCPVCEPSVIFDNPAELRAHSDR